MSGGEDGGRPAASGTQRLDKWLWFARIVKSRTLAASQVTGGKIRVNRIKANKPSHPVQPGDVITSSAQKTVRILRVKAPGVRRGPAAEAALLFEDLTPPPVASPADRHGAGGSAGSAQRELGTGRPTKRERRQIDKFRGRGE